MTHQQSVIIAFICLQPPPSKLDCIALKVVCVACCQGLGGATGRETSSEWIAVFVFHLTIKHSVGFERQCVVLQTVCDLTACAKYDRKIVIRL